MRGLMLLSFTLPLIMNNFIAVDEVLWELSARAGWLCWSWGVRLLALLGGTMRVSPVEYAALCFFSLGSL